MHTLKSDTFSGPGILKLSTGARLPINTGDPVPAAYLEALEVESLPDGVTLEEIEDFEAEKEGEALPDGDVREEVQVIAEPEDDDEPDEDDEEFEES